MRVYFERALKNITKFGDTDIFPFPIENHVFFDKAEETIALLEDLDQHFDERLIQFPPHNHSALVPVGYTGFRSATQLDPLWNAFFLGVVLSIGTEIENARISKVNKTIFSYRLTDNQTEPDLFDPEYNWRSFLEQSIHIAKTFDLRRLMRYFGILSSYKSSPLGKCFGSTSTAGKPSSKNYGVSLEFLQYILVWNSHRRTSRENIVRIVIEPIGPTTSS